MLCWVVQKGKGFGFGKKTMLRFHTEWNCEKLDSHVENLIRTRTELLLGVR